MGRQAKLRKARRALRTAVHCENLTVDEANEAYREAKGREPKEPECS